MAEKRIQPNLKAKESISCSIKSNKNRSYWSYREEISEVCFGALYAAKKEHIEEIRSCILIAQFQLLVSHTYMNTGCEVGITVTTTLWIRRKTKNIKIQKTKDILTHL